MTPAWFSSNLLMYALQIGALIAAAGIVSPLLRMQAPKVRLFYGHMVLLACLLLPFVRSWKQSVTGGMVEITTSVSIVAPPRAAAPIPLSTSEIILIILGAGILVRAVLLCMGFRRLRRYRIHSQPLSPTSSWSGEADMRVSSEVPGPVTFGFLHPVVLLPANFAALDTPIQEAILCHEIMHVRRNDWLFTVGEELVRAVFWFHPAIWWLLSEIQLAREQTVDREVVAITKGRDNYVDALLAIAGATHRFDVAPSFLRKRHLKRRVFSILKEIKMSEPRVFSTLAASVGMLAAACWFISGVLPLQAAPQTQVVAGLPEPWKQALMAPPKEADIREEQPQPTSGKSRRAVVPSVNADSDPSPAVLVADAGPDQVDPRAAPQQAADAPSSPPPQLRIGGKVAAANILEQPKPVYPPEAKAARVEGTVRLGALIGLDGHIVSMNVISGPPELVASALEAVRQWVYRPTLLNGNPVEVLTTIDVNYTLMP